MRLDRMDSMAIRTYRRLPIASPDCLSMDARAKFFLHIPVALCTGCGNIELEDRRLGIVRGKNLVHSVAIGTDCGFIRARSHGAPMDAFLIREKRLCAVTASLHHKFLAV